MASTFAPRGKRLRLKNCFSGRYHHDKERCSTTSAIASSNAGSSSSTSAAKSWQPLRATEWAAKAKSAFIQPARRSRRRHEWRLLHSGRALPDGFITHQLGSISRASNAGDVSAAPFLFRVDMDSVCQSFAYGVEPISGPSHATPNPRTDVICRTGEHLRHVTRIGSSRDYAAEPSASAPES